MASATTWTNWAGNQSCAPARIVRPRDEHEIADAVRSAVDDGLGVRVLGTGHSFSPVIGTDGALLDLSALAGVMSVDADRSTVTALPATTVGMFGDPLWDLGFALHNQGDIATQQIAGAVATGTHGSGVELAGLSGMVRAMRLITAAGDVLDIGADQPDLLHAAQVAIGMLGVITRIELEVVPAHRLAERIEHMPYAEVMARWDELTASHRHFSFFWLPSEESAALYGLHDACRDDADRHLLRQDLRPRRARPCQTRRRPAGGSTAATGSTRWSSSRTSTSSSTSCRSTAPWTRSPPCAS